jgi:hypothetical protein
MRKIRFNIQKGGWMLKGFTFEPFLAILEMSGIKRAVFSTAVGRPG